MLSRAAWGEASLIRTDWAKKKTTSIRQLKARHPFFFITHQGTSFVRKQSQLYIFCHRSSFPRPGNKLWGFGQKSKRSKARPRNIVFRNPEKRIHSLDDCKTLLPQPIFTNRNQTQKWSQFMNKLVSLRHSQLTTFGPSIRAFCLPQLSLLSLFCLRQRS